MAPAGLEILTLAGLDIFDAMKIVSRSVQETLRVGKAIAAHLKKGDILCLVGQLGSGKTVLTKGIAIKLGIKPDTVISPTFVLIRQYQGRWPLYHFDLYRVNSHQEILVLGYEEYFYGDGITVIEWADRLGCLLPREYLKISLALGKDSTRSLELSACGIRYQALLKDIKKALKR
jgi:tRNA threonylcarbamoyladenosine biosynthesis protein TsaE